MPFSLRKSADKAIVGNDKFLGDPSWQSIRDAIENIDPSAKRGVSRKPTNTGTKDAELTSLFQSGFTTVPNSKEEIRGGEHTVEFRNGRAYKQTHPESFGAKYDPAEPANLKWGTPLEYLRRWREHLNGCRQSCKHFDRHPCDIPSYQDQTLRHRKGVAA
jgi:hypothetical protein